jgi:hypothetical protein
MSKTETNTTTPPNPTTGASDFDAQAIWTKMFADGQARAHQFAAQYAQLEAQMMERAKQAIDTWAQLAQDALAYSAQLSAQARKLGFEAARKFQA